MSLEHSIREFVGLLSSNKALDRRKAAEKLKEFLTRNAVPSLLTKNTLAKKGITWDTLFDDIHDYVLKECEKYESSKTFSSITAPTCSMLLQLCVAGANKGRAYIKCDKLTDACLLVLRDPRLARAVGDAYFNVLYKNVMLCEHYLSFITPSTWEELLDAVLQDCISSRTSVDSFAKLRLLLLIIKNGNQHTQFTVALKDSLQKTKQCFLKFSEDKKMHEIIVDISVVLLEALSTECRLSMCEFNESILTYVLKFYDQNSDHKKKASLYKLLHLSMTLHHPEGRHQLADGSLASDWAVWTRHMNGIMEVMCLEVAVLQRIKKMDLLKVLYASCFHKVCAAVYYQVVHTRTPSTSADEENPVKRKRESVNRNRTFTDLVQEMKQNHVPWLAILKAYVQKFGKSISKEQYVMLLNALELLVINNTVLDWSNFSAVTCSVLCHLSPQYNSKEQCREVFLPLWNICVRNATQTNSSSNASHEILLSILNTDVLQYKDVHTLLQMYLEKEMPLGDASVILLTTLFAKFYNNCANVDTKQKGFRWLLQKDIFSLHVNINDFSNLLSKLILNENSNEIFIKYAKRNNVNDLHNKLFVEVEKSILFSEFEELNETDQPIRNQINLHLVKTKYQIEQDVEMKKTAEKYFLESLDLKEGWSVDDYVQNCCLLLAYVNIILHNTFTTEQVLNSDVMRITKRTIKHVYETVTASLNNDRATNKNEILVQMRIFLGTEWHPVLNSEVRKYAEESFFYSINNILNAEETKINEDDMCVDNNDSEYLRHGCICLLADYCKKGSSYRNEILDLILDFKLYNFSKSSEIECAIECIEILTSSDDVDNVPIENIFHLMQNMCRILFRNSDASYKIIRSLSKLLDKLWAREDLKQNCLIMVKSYLQRCEKLFYPPTAAALVYECVAKIIILNKNQCHEVEDSLKDALVEKTKGSIHCLRLYTCYLMREVAKGLSDVDVEVYLEDMDTFRVNVANNSEQAIKDELQNRTLTFLHKYYALAITKSSLLKKIVTQTIQIQKEKSLDKKLIKKVLNKITHKIIKKDIEDYLTENILSILYFWFSKKNSIKDLPLYLFGFDSLDGFIKKYLKWLIPAEIMWRKEGNVVKSDALNAIKSKTGAMYETVIEECFPNMIVLCLPYVVIEKYRIQDSVPYARSELSQHIRSANEMLNLTRGILEYDKWSKLFVQYIGDIMLLTASLLRDCSGAREMFGVKISQLEESFYYTKNVYLALLQYFGDLTEVNIMQHLCENNPLILFKILYRLWEAVLNDQVIEFKTLRLYTFLTFLQSIPLGFPLDAFVSNYLCNSLINTINISNSKEEIRICLIALRTVLNRYLPDRSDVLKQTLTKGLSILAKKNEEGYEEQCSSCLEYLVDVMKTCLDGEDVVDFVSTVSQRTVDYCVCSCRVECVERLKTYRARLDCPSHETLSSLHEFLKANKKYVNSLCDDLSDRGFSEDCQNCVCHQIITALGEILKNPNTDEKTIIAACNCFSEIGVYDLKTLVTVAPKNTSRLLNSEPSRYLAIAVVNTMMTVLFNEDPKVTSKASSTLGRLFQFRDGIYALDVTETDKKILQPFMISSVNGLAGYKIDESTFSSYSGPEFWLPLARETHAQWLTRITASMLDVVAASSNYLKCLSEVCVIKPSVSKEILPALIGLIVSVSSEKHVKVIGDRINRFFEHIWRTTFDCDAANTADSGQCRRTTQILSYDHKRIVQYMIEVVNFTRLQRHHYNPRPEQRVETLNYLLIDYSKVAWAATIAEQHLTALYYGELWWAQNNGGVPPSSPETAALIPGGDNLQKIFRKCFVSIGEMDAIDGCGTAHLTIDEEKRKHLINTGQYSDALLLHDIALSCDALSDVVDLQYGVVRSLHKSGMHHLALQYIKSMPECDEVNDIKYECLAALGDWNDFVNTQALEEKSCLPNINHESILKALRYACLKDCLNLHITNDCDNRLTIPLNRAKLAVHKLCQNLNMENCQNVYKVVEKLHLFTDIENYFSVRNEKTSIGDLLIEWKVEKLPRCRQFKYLESIINQRCLLLEDAAKSYAGFVNDIVNLQLGYAELGLSKGRVQMAQRLLAIVKKLQRSEEVSLTEAKISWAKGHTDIALSLLRNVVTNLSYDENLAAVALRQYGMWMAESKCDNGRDIIKKYLKKSLDVLSNRDHEDTRLKVYYDIATFADSEYKQVVAYMNSSVFENKLKCLENMKDTATSLKSTQLSLLTKDERKVMMTNERFSVMDEVQIASTKAEKEQFLQLAMKYYLLSLKHSEEHDLSVFRVISLWLDNPSIQLSAEGDGGTFDQLIHSVPSHKFVTVLPQIAPRLTNDNTPFAHNLTRIIKRCATDHPHHTLPILFSLKNSDKDKQILNAAAGVSQSTQRIKTQEPRILTADTVIRELSRDNDVLAVVIAQMGRLCDAIISLANYKPRTKDHKQKIPAAEPITKLKGMDCIPIPTDNIPVRKDCNYAYISSLEAFDNSFELVGGINCPKKTVCRGSDGKNRILLVKGEDDLRQDAVMQQVFHIVNTLLESNPVTSTNKLHIRTYKVVPMSRRSGVLQWCEGTIPLGTYLTGTPGSGVGAHERYRPMDISCNAARKKLTELYQNRKSNSEKLSAFLRILKDFKPVFHYFFTEHYLDPVTWYERRLAYTKSVATSSMVGYILGLGDRHVQNILVDKLTAEVIHIDFGIAFEQGKALPTPETIPFRLTQDMIAGLGSGGVEGIFNKSCEKTMQLLRDNQATLLTILEVLLCDPLYCWTAASNQQDANANAPTYCSNGSLAQRALLEVSSKLSGTEGGATGGVAVRGQVARLLRTATDPVNLSRLFPGWQPYL